MRTFGLSSSLGDAFDGSVRSRLVVRVVLRLDSVYSTLRAPQALELGPPALRARDFTRESARFRIDGALTVPFDAPITSIGAFKCRVDAVGLVLVSRVVSK